MLSSKYTAGALSPLQPGTYLVRFTVKLSTFLKLLGGLTEQSCAPLRKNRTHQGHKQQKAGGSLSMVQHQLSNSVFIHVWC